MADPLDATFIFQSNFPWRDDLPCSGSLFVKTGGRASDMMRDWWDYDLPQKNNVDFMEQDTLWYQLEAPVQEFNFSINYKDSVTLVSESQFPSEWHGIHDLWLVHVPNYNTHRGAYFKTM